MINIPYQAVLLVLPNWISYDFYRLRDAGGRLTYHPNIHDGEHMGRSGYSHCPQSLQRQFHPLAITSTVRLILYPVD